MAIANPASPKARDIDAPQIETTSVMTFARDCQSRTIHIDDSVERELVALPPGAAAREYLVFCATAHIAPMAFLF